MLDLKFVRENVDRVSQMLMDRQMDMDLKASLELDEERRRILREVEELKHRRNVASDEISRLKREKQGCRRPHRGNARGFPTKSRRWIRNLPTIEQKFRDFLLLIPNMPHESVVVGKDEKDNPGGQKLGEIPLYSSFEPKPHWEIGESLGILDFERAARMTGARFALYWGMGAALERALISFMLDIHTQQHGYTEVLPPFMVNSASLLGTGQLPKFKEDLFKLEGRDLYLVPTAEVPVTNIHMNEILEEEDLPKLLHRLYPLFPIRSGLLRKRHSRTHSPAPVQQGGTGEVGQTGNILRGTGRACFRMRRRSSRNWELPLSRGLAVYGRPWAFPHPRPTTSKCGCRDRTRTGRFLPAVTLKTSRPDGPISGFGAKDRPRRNWFIP